jgi:hypothetical protein
MIAMVKRSRLSRNGSKPRSSRLPSVGMTVPQIENLARKLMLVETSIWEKHGWEDGGMVVKPVYEKELKAELQKLGVTKLNPIFYDIFEDANWHTMNEALVKFGVLVYPTESDNKVFDAYRSQGGRTWQLT